MPIKSLILGGGDLGSGVALRLVHAGISVVITELPQPYSVRRTVCFSQAVYDGQINIEGVEGRLFSNYGSIPQNISIDIIPILIDPDARCIELFQPDVIVDGRMAKKVSYHHSYPKVFTIGLGPGFIVGENCHAVIETQRGHFMGRVYYSGSAEEDTGIPDRVANFQRERVLRSPSAGIFNTDATIGQCFKEGQEIARVGEMIVKAPFTGMLRGLLHDELPVTEGVKIGDIDPRTDPMLCKLVSDKALAVGGGVLEAIFTQPFFRKKYKK
jgi:xanthine dehydrogenase accessory factor